MKIHIPRVLMAFLFGAAPYVLNACKSPSASDLASTAVDEPPSAAAPAAAASSFRDRPLTQKELPTTDAALFLENYDLRIESFVQAEKKAGKPIGFNCAMHANDHRVRGQYTENLADFGSVLKYAEQCLANGMDVPPTHLLIATGKLAMHKFGEAKDSVDKAKAKGLDDGRYKFFLANILWEKGSYPQAEAIIRGAAQAKPSVTTLTRLAVMLHAIGQYAEAEQAFEAAEDLIADPNPLIVAWIETRRGDARVAAGRPEAARPFFESALRRLPNYKPAREGLAEADAAQGDVVKALKELKALALNKDPDLAAGIKAIKLLASVDAGALPTYLATLKPAIVVAFKPVFEALLLKYPEVAWRMAGEFYLSIGSLDRAAKLLEKDFALRPDAGAFALQAELRMAQGKTAEAVLAIKQAIAMAPKSAKLHATAAAILTDKAEKEAQVAAAKALNPHIFDQKRFFF